MNEQKIDPKKLGSVKLLFLQNLWGYLNEAERAKYADDLNEAIDDILTKGESEND